MECRPTGASVEIDCLIEVLLQIDDAVRAEAGHRLSGFRVERDEPIAGRDVENPLLFAVGPIRQPAARELPRRGRPRCAFMLAMHPQQLAGAGVEGDDGAARPAGGIEPAAHHQRRRFEVELGPRTEIVGLEPPRHFERR